MRLPKSSDKSGFTLLEILVTVTILAIAFTSIFRLFGGTLRTIETSQRYSYATVIAEEAMSRALLEKSIGESFEQSDLNANGYSVSTAIEEYKEPIGAFEDEQTGDTPMPVTYKLTVRVAWKDGANDKAMELTSLQTIFEEEK